MSRHRPVWIALIAFIHLSLCAASAYAQDLNSLAKMDPHSGLPARKLFVFGVGGGFSLPVNDAKDALKNGFNGSAYVRVQPGMLPISFGVNVAFQKFDLSDAKVSTGTTPPTGSTNMLAGLGDMKYDLMPGPIRPYLLVGIGVYNLQTDAQTVGGSSTSETNFGINGGAGVEFKLFAISGFVQGRIDNVYTSSGGTIDTKSIQVIPITLGIEF